MTDPLPAPDPAPIHRVPDTPFPPYRFVPGLNPHPFRHPDGHMYTDGSAPSEEDWDPTLSWEQDPAWLRGMDLFDHRFYWEAHEAWEATWHSVPREDPFSELLQGLIQASAFLLKMHLDHCGAAERLREASLAKLRSVLALEGSPWRGVNLARLVDEIEQYATGCPWPLLS